MFLFGSQRACGLSSWLFTIESRLHSLASSLHSNLFKAAAPAEPTMLESLMFSLHSHDLFKCSCIQPTEITQDNSSISKAASSSHPQNILFLLVQSIGTLGVSGATVLPALTSEAIGSLLKGTPSP